MKNIYLLLSATMCLFIFSNQAFSQGSGRAYDFNSNYIDIPDDPSLNPSNITLEAWIKADSWAPNIWQNVIISKDGWATGDQGYSIRAGANGSLSFNISIAGTWTEVASGPLMSAGKWYHVAGTYDGAMLRLFLNGNQIDSLSATGVIDNGAYNVSLGKMTYVPGGGRYFDGNIDDARIWNSAIPQSSIREFMCKKMTTSHPQYGDLVGHWNMDGIGTVVDQSPLGNDGTAVGALQVNSGAPIGDESVYTYAASPNLSMTNGTIDSVNVTSTSPLTTVHIYRVNSAPLNNTTASFIDSVDQNHYWGVYAASAGSFNYTMNYYYPGNPFYAGTQNNGILAGRTNGAAASWGNTAATHDIPNTKYTSTLNNTREFRLGFDCPGFFVNAQSSLSFCMGDSVTISDVGPGTIHQWYNAAGPLAGETGSTFTTGISGDYYVVVNDGACAATSQTFEVDAHVNPIAMFGTLNPIFCENDLDEPIVNGIPSTGGTYSGTGINGSTFSPSTAGAGSFDLVYTVIDTNQCTDADTISVMVNAAPSVPVIVQTGTDLCVTMVPGMLYQWYENGVAIPGANTDCYTATTNGNYTVVAVNADNCDETSLVYNLNDLSTNELNLNHQINMYPNPAKEWVNVVADDIYQDFTIMIYDGQGRMIYDNNEPQSNHQINVTTFQKGIYFVHINSKFGSSVKKLKVK